MPSSTLRYATLLLALFSTQQVRVSASSSNLRRGSSSSSTSEQNSPSSQSSKPQDQDQNQRSLYQREQKSGLKVLFPLGAAKKQLEKERNPGTSTEYVGPVVSFDEKDDASSSSSSTTNDFQTRIVGGSNSHEQKAFTMHLRYDSTWQTWNFAGCGGTLISECHILTAAHCVADGRQGLPNGVYVNAYAPFKGNEGKAYHFSLVEEVVIHPQFDNDDNHNDIAIIEMKTCITDTVAFPPMQVATPEYMAEHVQTGTELTVMGFGKLSTTDSTLTNYLQQVEVPYIDSNACKALYGADRIYDGDMFCAGNTRRGGVDACQGDSGGPLVLNATSPSPTVVGIVSWGTGCADKRFPGVYASTAYHLEFIQETVCPHPLVASGPSQLCAATIFADLTGGLNATDSNSTSVDNEPTKATPQPTPSPAPTPAPTPKPSPSPTEDCGLRYDFCISNSECCDDMGLICHRNQCIRPSAGGAAKQSLYGRRNGN